MLGKENKINQNNYSTTNTYVNENENNNHVREFINSVKSKILIEINF